MIDTRGGRQWGMKRTQFVGFHLNDGELKKLYRLIGINKMTISNAMREAIKFYLEYLEDETGKK